MGYAIVHVTAKLLDGKVTVTVQPFFWLMAGLLGASVGGGTAGGILLGAAVVAFSVFFHEAGHAAACLAFDSGADVVLHGFGGATRPRHPARFGTWQVAALDLAGCAAGGALAATAFAILLVAGIFRILLPTTIVTAAATLVEVNIWFSLFNLLPVAPMDGGKLVQGLLVARFGVGGRRVGHALGLACGGLAALWFFSRGATYGAFLCGALAVGEGRSFRRALAMTAVDADPGVNDALRRALEMWAAGRREDAVAALTALRQKTGSGLTFAAATVQLACFLALLGRDEESYALFQASDEADLAPAAKRICADVALRRGDFARALRLGRTNFHDSPGALTAAATAKSAAGMGDARETVAWLRTALRMGWNKAELRAPAFDKVRASPEFSEFVAEWEGR